MEERRARITVVILENRQMIGSILADLIAGAGYRTRVISEITRVQEVLAECMPALLLVDRGMIRPDLQSQWQSLEEAALASGVPVIAFSCSPLAETEGVLVLRSPGDFALVIARIEEEWNRKQPLLGTTLLGMGLLSREELEAALRIQRELSQLGRHLALGELLVRLGFVSQEDLEKALQAQES